MNLIKKICVTILSLILVGVPVAVIAASILSGTIPSFSHSGALPVSSSRDLRELTPRQYLNLKYPEYATNITKIIQCESGWKPEAKNKGSSATGLCQFLSGTWSSTRRRMGLPVDLDVRTDPYEMIDTCVWLYAHDGIRHWLESQSCHKIHK